MIHPKRFEEIKHVTQDASPTGTWYIHVYVVKDGHRGSLLGTTSVRVLETCASEGALRPGEGWTRLLIRPPHAFGAVDAMLTNFHLPRSTLMMLVSAFAGHANIRKAYEHAVRERYRFFSYGDAMLLERASQ